MQASNNIHLISKKSFQPITKKHKEVIDKLELMLEKGIPDHTMSQLAAKLKVSLRTLYEIAPSKDHLIRMTVNRILMRLGKEALEIVADIKSPIEKLKKYLQHVNQAVGPKFKVYLQNLGNNNKSKEMIEDVEQFSKRFRVQEEMELPKWEMSGETRQIGQYTCYKATMTKIDKEIDLVLKVIILEKPSLQVD